MKHLANEDKWTRRYLDLAGHIANWSKDPSTQCGAVVIGDYGQILSTGFNGFPRGIKDDSRLHDRETKYKHIIHAEMNTIYNASLTSVSLKNSTIYVWGLPVCSQCALGVIQSGIKTVVVAYPEKIHDKWKESGQLTEALFKEAGVQYFKFICD